MLAWARIIKIVKERCSRDIVFSVACGVPAEYFTQLGLDIKNRSPFRHTHIVALANDWIGYLPNLEGHKLGGYQV